jgi:type II secretory pathway pseudopilin PulG
MSAQRKDKRRARSASGFTIIEVIVAMGVMVIGVMALVGLQSHTMHVNSFARQMTTAGQIAQTWLERMKQDAQTWTEPGGALPDFNESPVQVLAATQWLQQVNAAPGRFQAIPMGINTSGAFDFQGNELLSGSAIPPYFCTSFKPQWVWSGHAIRVDVRVFWPRERASAIVNCIDNDAALNPGGALVNRFHFYYLSTVIKYMKGRR